MKKGVRWALLVWTIIAFPFAAVDCYDFTELFFLVLYAGLIVGLMIHDLRA